ncbi:MAG: cytochrome c nitrite reductase small subunit [Chloroflexota bacterium]
MNKIPLPLLIAVAAFVIAMGVFVLATDAAAYAGTHPETCNNCHVMHSMYENYYHAAHQPWAECADCHLPHENVIAYYFEKGRQGAHDVYVFTTGQTPEAIRANEHSQEIIQANCIRCHEETVETITMGPQAFDRNCWDCHRAVAHGDRGLSNSPYQDSTLYPVK